MFDFVIISLELTATRMWIKMMARVLPNTGLGPLMEADAGSLTEHTPRHHHAGIGLWETAGPCSRVRSLRNCQVGSGVLASKALRLLDTTDTAGCLRRAESRVGGLLTGSSLGSKGKGPEEGSSWEDRVLGLLSRWMGLVETISGKVERPPVWD